MVRTSKRPVTSSAISSTRKRTLSTALPLTSLNICIITDTDIYLIQVLPHVEEEWVNTQLIQILHDNWPETIAHANHRLMKPETFSTLKRQSLRSYNANFVVTVPDGTVYLPLSGRLY